MPMHLQSGAPTTTTNSVNQKDQHQDSLQPEPEQEQPNINTTEEQDQEEASEEEDPLPLSPFFYPIDLPRPTPTAISDDLSEASSHLLMPTFIMSDEHEHEHEEGGPAMPRPEPMEVSLTQDLRMRSNTITGDDDDNDNDKEDSQRCLIDFCEWWCHKVITTTLADSDGTSLVIKEYQSELKKACDNLFTVVDKPTFGRLDNRLRLSTLSADVALLQVPTSTDGSKERVHEQWKATQEELILLKNLLLRQDANEDTTLVTHDQLPASLNANPNLQLEQHDLFTSQYKHVLQLLQVQYHLTIFYTRLVQMDSDTNGDPQKQKKLVRQAIDDYEKHINHLFQVPPPTTVNNNNKAPVSDNGSSDALQEEEDVSVTDDDDDDDNDEDVRSVTSHDVRALPSELVGFLLKDLYQSSQQQSNQQQQQRPLATRLLKHVQSILTGNGKYSHVKTQTAVRNLLVEWQDLVLEQPMLVQLGYGPSNVHNNDTTNNNNNNSKQEEVSPRKRQAEAEEDAMLRRLSLQCSGGLPMDNVSDIGEDDDEVEQEQPPAQKKRRIVDSSDELSTSSSSKVVAIESSPESHLPSEELSPSSPPSPPSET